MSQSTVSHPMLAVEPTQHPAFAERTLSSAVPIKQIAPDLWDGGTLAMDLLAMETLDSNLRDMGPASVALAQPSFLPGFPSNLATNHPSDLSVLGRPSEDPAALGSICILVNFTIQLVLYVIIHHLHL